MAEIQLTIRNAVGLHARPAALFVQEANKHKAGIQVRLGEKVANAKSILSILALGVDQGCVITISTEGEDAQEALSALKALVDSNFGESL